MDSQRFIMPTVRNTALVLGLVVLLGFLLIAFQITSLSPIQLMVGLGCLGLIATPLISYFFVQTIHKLETSQQEVHRLSYTDELTGLFTRQYFFEVAHRELLSSYRYGYPVSLLMVDIDGFKRVNDTCGHLVGDHTLRNCAKVIQESLRETDFFARFGGEEFVVLMPHANQEQAMMVAERVRVAIESLLIMSEGHEVKITASIGLTSTDSGSFEITELVSQAEAALEASKVKGGNKVSEGVGDAKALAS